MLENEAGFEIDVGPAENTSIGPVGKSKRTTRSPQRLFVCVWDLVEGIS